MHMALQTARVTVSANDLEEVKAIQLSKFEPPANMSGYSGK